MGLASEGIDLLKLVNKAQNVDLYRELAGWIDKVKDLQTEKEQIRAERDQLREQIRFKGVIERIGGHTFVQGDDEEICARCAEVDLRPVHLMSLTNTKSGAVKTRCPECEIELPYHYPAKRSQTPEL